ncbi:retron St85 family RNA-directed DNA polymerase [Thioalkalivibrio sp. ALMg3]|uniref:retron St85 family RNA-directed DNA polymerase n=1 Tax=Thioalkalivibrio sp. ALMg3 TaxID=1158163 RepID=UPI0009DA058F|nr:retron St85 family RNA-directed DNA polymerase [Thioalkalivibrio sp. ALMg3]
MNIRERIAADLHVSHELIDRAVWESHSKVKKFRIKKRNGGTRPIFHPSKKTKLIQQWIIHNILNHLPVHDAAMAYRKGLSTVDNARKHRQNRYFLRIDLTNFFPSITYNDLEPLIREWHSHAETDWTLDPTSELLLKHTCFSQDETLRIGDPSSPSISNAVMASLDETISNTVRALSKNPIAYTRYADDLIFSTNERGLCKPIHEHTVAVIEESTSPLLSVNRRKTRFLSRSGGSAIVTGIKINPDGSLTLPKSYRNEIRFKLDLYRKGKLGDSDVRELRGHLAYCKHAAAGYYSRLCGKHYREIEEITTSLQDHSC